MQQWPEGLIVRGDAHHVAIAAAIAYSLAERTLGAAQSGPRVTRLALRLLLRVAIEFAHYIRHSESRTRAATALASGGGTALATWRC